MSPLHEIEVSTRKRPYRMFFYAIWAGLVFFNFSTMLKKAELIAYIFGGVAVFLFVSLLRMLFGSEAFILTKEELVVRKKIFGIPFMSDRYNISGISQLRHVANSRVEYNRSAWTRGERLSYTLFTEATKTYEINPTLIYFQYEGATVKLGDDLEEFKGPMFIQAIKERQAQLRKEEM